ncbi:NUDIX domain-containing protein [Mycetocola spongiae]|uniref:NUDIX domain-containing protein n=1 Tax=Mycetocola spongiae TaxID=2859226 RepID=UPI001CF228D1|nr:NUDIX hydrolase [Mycetocola spongiae]UCR88093.1 NUDIX hydrolase [Mycetocola spongiae]
MNLRPPQIPLPRRLSRVEKFSNPWLTLYEDSVEFSPTHTGGYAILEKPDFSLVIPLAGHRVCLVRQYRYPVGRWGYEFPQGSTQDAGPRPSAEQEALRELREETGLIARSLEPLGSIHESAGISASRCHLFAAEIEAEAAAQPEPTEIISGILWVDRHEFWDLVARGEITDSPTIAAMGIYSRR